MSRGVLLERITWIEAEQHLTQDAVVVLPIGASSKEHGPHLTLGNDSLIADYMRDRVVDAAEVVMAPTLGYHFYPAFVEYPGSVSLRLETARDLVVDIVTSLAAFGPRRFYAINTGVSTVRALAPAAEILRQKGILLRYTDVLQLLAPVEKGLCSQPGGSHADEAETSMMLVIAPHTVDMTKAVCDFDADGKGRLTRTKGTGLTYSPSGVWGDATLATKAKGEKIVAAYVAGLLADIETVRRAPLPEAAPARSGTVAP